MTEPLEIERRLNFQTWAEHSLASLTLSIQREYNRAIKDFLDFRIAAITTGQRAPFQPIRLFGWAPGWTK